MFSNLFSSASRRRTVAKLPPHVTRKWFHRHRSNPDKVALSLDVSNALNTMHGSAVLQAVRTHFPSVAPWIAVITVTRAPSSLAPAVSLLRLLPPQGAFNKGTSQVRFFSHSPSTLSSRKHDMLRRLPTPAASTRALFALMTGCVRDPLRPSGASSQLSSLAFVESAVRSTSTELKSSLLAPPLSLVAPLISMDAAGTGQPILSSLARLLAPKISLGPSSG